ncbi:MAG: ABC transporter ATP-binding protein [Planctomycetota bacterium]|nr:ABC transporter ATP-binding protein [Planctomycetaceae bacterium]MDQ3329567.1 ABC transporter ATP-binding protein [Planctomycetota bacterium]
MNSGVATLNAATISLRSVGKAFADKPPVLSDVSFDIAAGEFVAIVGPSGCGKSTFLRMLAGLDRPTEGSIMSHDDANSVSRTAFVFQEPALLPWRSVTANIALPLELEGVPRLERNLRVHECLSLIGLSDADAAKLPRQLSGGMRMRVSLARSLVTRPQLLLLDEPFAALDDILRQRLNAELHRLWLEQRWTAVFVTHNVAEAAFLANRVLVMSAHPGRVVEDVAVPFATPRDEDLRSTPEFARFVGEIARRLRRTDTPALPAGLNPAAF